MDRLRGAARRVSDFFERLGRGSRAPDAGGKEPPPSTEDMFTRRVVGGEGGKGGKSPPQEESGLTSRSLHSMPRDQGQPPVNTQHAVPPQRIPPNIQSPPATEASQATQDTTSRREAPAVAAQENEIRTGGHIPAADSADSAQTASNRLKRLPHQQSESGAIHVTDH